MSDEWRRLCTWQAAGSGAWLHHTCRVRKVAQRSRALWGSSALSAGISRLGTWPWLPQCRRTQSPLNTTVLSWPGNPLWRLSPPGHPSGVGLSTRALAFRPQHLALENSPLALGLGAAPLACSLGICTSLRGILPPAPAAAFPPLRGMRRASALSLGVPPRDLRHKGLRTHPSH